MQGSKGKPMVISDIKRAVPGVAAALSFGLLAACSSGGNSADGSSDRTNQTSRTVCPGGTTCGLLDPAQTAIADNLGGTLAGTLPDPLGPVVGCASDAVNNVVDVPDALLTGLQTAATTQDPAAVADSLNDIGQSLGNAAFNLQNLLAGLAGTGQPCDEAGSGEGGLPSLPGAGGVPGLDGLPGLGSLPIPGLGDGDGGSADGPTGTPLDLALAPLVDGLNTLVDALQGAADGTPAAAVIDPIVSGLDALLSVLQGGGVPSLPGGGDNPLTAALTDLQNQLTGIAGGGAPSIPGFPGLPGLPGGGSDGADVDLVPLTNVLSDVTDALSIAIGQGRTELEGAAGSEVPVIGGLLLTLETTLADAGVLLDAAGQYDGVATNAAVESLLENVLGNALTQVLPLELIGEQVGQDIAGPIRDGIAQGVSVLGDGTEMLIDPLFSMVLDDAASPVLDPIESVIAQLLASSPVDLGDTLAGGIGQLVGALTSLTSGGLPGLPDGGAGGAPSVPSLPGLPGAGGNPLDALLGGLPIPGLDGGLPSLPGGGATDGLTGTPLDLLLSALIDNDPTGLLAGILGPVAGALAPLLGLLGGLGELAP